MIYFVVMSCIVMFRFVLCSVQLKDKNQEKTRKKNYFWKIKKKKWFVKVRRKKRWTNQKKNIVFHTFHMSKTNRNGQNGNFGKHKMADSSKIPYLENGWSETWLISHFNRNINFSIIDYEIREHFQEGRLTERMVQVLYEMKGHDN